MTALYGVMKSQGLGLNTWRWVIYCCLNQTEIRPLNPLPSIILRNFLTQNRVVRSYQLAVFLVAGSCWVPCVIAVRRASGCRVGPVVQLRQGRTLAGWDHTEVALIPLVLTGHEGCPGWACQLGTVSPVVIAPCGHVFW